MTSYIFDSAVALDPATAELVKNTTGQVYAPDDLATPLEVTDLSGNAKSVVAIGELGLTEQFIVEDHPRVVFVSGAYQLAISSYEAMLEEAQTARDEAEAAKVAAEAAQGQIATFEGDIADLESQLNQLKEQVENGTGGGSGVLVLTNDDPDPEWTGSPIPFFRYEAPVSNLMAELAWVVTGTTGGTTTSTNVTANPADQVGGSAPQEGDIMVAILQNDTNVTSDPTAPAGWTRFIPSGLSGITGTMGSRVYWKVRGASDTSYTWTMPEAKHARLSIVGIRGAEAFANWTIGAAKVRYEGAPESTTSTAPSITSSRPTALAIAFVMERTTNNETDVSSFTPGWEKRAFFAQTGNVLGTLGIFEKAFAGAGSTGDFVATYPNAQSNNGAGFQILIGAGS